MPSEIDTGEGKKEVDLLELLPLQEAVINHVSGKMRNGKTYISTKMVLDHLKDGAVVYTSWKIKWDGYDERKSRWNMWKAKMGFKKEFLVAPKENWHYLPYDGVEDPVTSATLYAPYTNWMDKFLSLTDCEVWLDEGQIPLNTYESTRIKQDKQNAIFFTGHFNRSIYVISQRPIQVHPIVRANISRFYIVSKTDGWLGTKFLVREFQEIDSQGLPDMTAEPESEEEFSFDKKIAEAYDSKYMRGNVKESQKNLTRIEKITRNDFKKAEDVPTPPENFIERWKNKNEQIFLHE